LVIDHFKHMHRLRQFTLALGDLCALAAGLYAAVALRYFGRPGNELAELIIPMSQLFLAAIIINFIAGLYHTEGVKNSWRFYQKTAIAMLVWTGLGVLYFYINPGVGVSPKTILVLTAVFGFGLIAVWRYAYNRFLSTSIWQTNIVFVGITPEVSELADLIKREPQLGYRVRGVIKNQNDVGALYSDAPAFQALNELFAANSADPVNLVVLAPHVANSPQLLKDLYTGLFRQIAITNLADLYEELMKRIPPFTFSEGYFIANLKEHYKKIYDRFRILADYGAATIIGLIFAITFPIVGLVIKISSAGPIFYKQERVGRLGKSFLMYKYRTMKTLSSDGSAEVNGPQFAGHRDNRITWIGRLLRKSRIDELPQFINILKGQMAIIGPRPERPEFVSELTQKMPYYALRHLIKPGISGWAQVHNAYYGTIEENLRKLEYDLYYIKNRGPLLDLSILLRTVNILARMIGR